MFDLFHPRPVPATEEARTVNLLGAERGAIPRDEYWRAYHMARSLTDPEYLKRRRKRALDHWRKKHGK